MSRDNLLFGSTFFWNIPYSTSLITWAGEEEGLGGMKSDKVNVWLVTFELTG